jgi:hypothetical protein
MREKSWQLSIQYNMQIKTLTFAMCISSSIARKISFLSKNLETIRNNLYTYFREQVMIWYTAQMTNEEKKLVKFDNNLDVWKRYLVKRFRERSNIVMTKIIKKKYTMNDARKHCQLREYADVIIKASKSVELDSKKHLIMLIYNDLDLKFQRNISMSSLFIKLSNFLQFLDDKKNIWWDQTQRNANRNSYYEIS